MFNLLLLGMFCKHTHYFILTDCFFKFNKKPSKFFRRVPHSQCSEGVNRYCCIAGKSYLTLDCDTSCDSRVGEWLLEGARQPGTAMLWEEPELPGIYTVL